MTPVSRIWKDYRQVGALHAQVPMQAAIDHRTFVTRNGQLFTVLATEGIDYECLDPGQLDHVVRRFENTLRTFDERFHIYQHLCKRSHPPIPSRSYDNAVVQEAITNRTRYLNDRSENLFQLEIHFVIVYDAPRKAETLRGQAMRFVANPKTILRRNLSINAQLEHQQRELDQACALLREKVDSFVVQLQDVVPLKVLDKNEAFRFLRRLLNYSPYKADVGLKYDSFIDFFACDSTLECHRDHLRLDDDYVRVLTLKEPPSQTFPNLLRGLVEIPAHCIIVSEWTRESNARMRHLIQTTRRHFHNTKASILASLSSTASTSPKDQLVDDGAVALVNELGASLEELEVNGRYFGQYSLTIVLYDQDAQVVQRAVADAFKVFATYDGHLVEERYNLLNAWLAILPGNGAYNLRRFYLLNTNYADLSFLFGQRIGRVVNRHLGAEYLAVLETESGTPYFLNLHHQDTAHSLIIGATGSGKSFLLNFLITHLQKYAPRTVIFDLGGSYESLTRLFGGAYAAIGHHAHNFSINPFCLPPTPENLHFLASFCRVLIEAGGYSMSSEDERDLVAQVENVYAVDPEQRRLLTLANILNRKLREQLHKWVEGGPAARWFDNVTDTVTLAPFQAFDFEGLDTYPEIVEPLIFYLLHRASTAIYDASLAATFKVFILDEAWRFFRHPLIQKYVVEALKTWRKKNAAMILATQSVADLHHSELLPVVVESCVTQFFLANPGMDKATYRDVFHLNATEAERIAGLIPKKQLLIKQPDLAKVVNLNVDRKSYWLFTNNPADNVQKQDAFARHGLAAGLDILARSHS